MAGVTANYRKAAKEAPTPYQRELLTRIALAGISAYRVADKAKMTTEHVMAALRGNCRVQTLHKIERAIKALEKPK